MYVGGFFVLWVKGEGREDLFKMRMVGVLVDGVRIDFFEGQDDVCIFVAC